MVSIRGRPLWNVTHQKEIKEMDERLNKVIKSRKAK